MFDDCLAGVASTRDSSVLESIADMLCIRRRAKSRPKDRLPHAMLLHAGVCEAGQLFTSHKLTDETGNITDKHPMNLQSPLFAVQNGFPSYLPRVSDQIRSSASLKR